MLLLGIITLVITIPLASTYLSTILIHRIAFLILLFSASASGIDILGGLFQTSIFQTGLLLLPFSLNNKFSLNSQVRFFSSNNTLKKKSKFQRFAFGLKKGIYLELLPDNVLIFHNSVIVRIFRVIGGISFILWISKLYLKSNISLVLILPFVFIHLIYITIISFIKIKYLIYLWKNGKLEVRNSPVDKFATFGFRLAACAKGVCVYGAGTGTTIALGLGIDELLAHSGRPAIFKPIFGGTLDRFLTKVGVENPNREIVNIKNEIDLLTYKIKSLNNLQENLKEINSIETTTVEDKILLSEVKNALNEEILIQRSELEKTIEKKIQESSIIKEIYKDGSPFKK